MVELVSEAPAWMLGTAALVGTLCWGFAKASPHALDWRRYLDERKVKQ